MNYCLRKIGKLLRNSLCLFTILEILALWVTGFFWREFLIFFWYFILIHLPLWLLLSLYLSVVVFLSTVYYTRFLIFYIHPGKQKVPLTVISWWHVDLRNLGLHWHFLDSFFPPVRRYVTLGRKSNVFILQFLDL